MLMDVDKLIFRKLKMKIVDNSNSINRVDTSYPHRNENCILLNDIKLSGLLWGYHHIHSTY